MKNTKKYLFWIKSSRGTNSKKIVELPANLTKEQRKERLEEWCSGFGAWEASDNYVSYGVNALPRISKKK